MYLARYSCSVCPGVGMSVVLCRQLMELRSMMVVYPLLAMMCLALRSMGTSCWSSM